jgi:hypothetical protein
MVSGSSYSAAHISGMMALVSELRPGLALARIRDGVVASADQHGTDFCATMARVTEKCTCVCGAIEARRFVRTQ